MEDDCGSSSSEQPLVASGLFRKFTLKESMSNMSQMKQSDIKKLKIKLLKDYPYLEPYLGDLMPRKEIHRMLKCSQNTEVIISVKGEPLFFRQRKSPYIPTLKLLHKFPFLLPVQTVDKGAIRFLLAGANMMCPGLTSAGGHLNEQCNRLSTIVAIKAEGVENVLAIGLMKMTPNEIKTINKGNAIDVVHHIGDGLWSTNVK